MPTINLMSEGAQFRAAVDRIARLWLAALIVVFAAVTPLCAWSWRQRSQVAC
ncbi:MAG TPA: hypothetical protein PJ982_11050 [Lacipirellulaceae bacterium]|nr:hypothetical protein [Lacipirellulaceae bacterium]